jgi:hypothetical protein
MGGAVKLLKGRADKRGISFSEQSIYGRLVKKAEVIRYKLLMMLNSMRGLLNSWKILS